VTEMKMIYRVNKLTLPVKIDADWAKPQWKNIEPANITNYMGDVPDFQPQAQAKMMYDNNNLYVIFRVKDRFIRCITKDFNGPVWEDSCVEFFFAPDNKYPERYFNLEINCGGTPLMHYNTIAGKETKVIDPVEIAKIEIAHTLSQVVDPEIKEELSWSVEYRIPLKLLEKFSDITYPEPGAEWRANFYKIAENNSNPHYITWSEVINNKPNFHIPQYFGLLKFQ
jgi:hypothetical protein